MRAEATAVAAPPVALELDLDVFDGPFDLLVTLILKDEIDIWEVRVSSIIAEYVLRLADSGEFDLDATSQFVVLVAALLEMKSRLLLEEDVEEELEDLDPDEAAERLLERLVRYSQFKNAAQARCVRAGRSTAGGCTAAAPVPAGLLRRPAAEGALPAQALRGGPGAAAARAAGARHQPPGRPGRLAGQGAAPPAPHPRRRRRVHLRLGRAARPAGARRHLLRPARAALRRRGRAAPERHFDDIVVTRLPGLRRGRRPGDAGRRSAVASGCTVHQPTLDLMPTLVRRLEALLFISSRPLPLAEMAAACEAGDEAGGRRGRPSCVAEYAEGRRGLVLKEVAGGFTFAVAADCENDVRRLTGAERPDDLTPALLETLAVVAYLQPVTRADVAEVRGVSSEWALSSLEERGLVEQQGRADTPGSPILYGTGERFLKLFGLDAADGLPPLEEFALRGVRRGRDPRPAVRQCREETGVSQPMNLVVYLARAGVGSRRSCDELIRDGAVTVNGEVVTFPRQKIGEEDVVAVNGEPVEPRELRYFLVNKPRGVASTRSDPHAERVIVDLVPNGRILFPVGRLDVDTTGLIVLTNDGVLANRLMHPRYGVPKTYAARVRGKVSRTALWPRCARAWSWRTGSRRRPRSTSRSRAPRRPSSRSPSTRAASARCGACSRPSACPVEELHRRRYGPSPTRGWSPAASASSAATRSRPCAAPARRAPRTSAARSRGRPSCWPPRPLPCPVRSRGHGRAGARDGRRPSRTSTRPGACDRVRGRGDAVGAGSGSRGRRRACRRGRSA